MNSPPMAGSERNLLMNPQSAQPETPETSSPAFVSQPGGDHDQPYTWGRPTSTYLSFRQTVRLTILRSRIGAIREERIASAQVQSSQTSEQHAA